MDGKQDFVIEYSLADVFADLEKHQLDNWNPSMRKLCVGLFGEKDTDIVVDRYTSDLKRAGLNVCIDEDGIETGDEFKTKIVRAITNSEAFLFFSSAASNESPWTVKEVNVTVLLKKRVIPVKLDSTIYQESILFDLAGVDYIDHQTIGYEAAISKLLAALGKQYVPVDEDKLTPAIVPSQQKVEKPKRVRKVVKKLPDSRLSKDALVIKRLITTALGFQDCEFFPQTHEEACLKIQRAVKSKKELSKADVYYSWNVDDNPYLSVEFYKCEPLPEFELYKTKLSTFQYVSHFGEPYYSYEWSYGSDVTTQNLKNTIWKQLVKDI